MVDHAHHRRPIAAGRLADPGAEFGYRAIYLHSVLKIDDPEEHRPGTSKSVAGVDPPDAHCREFSGPGPADGYLRRCRFTIWTHNASVFRSPAYQGAPDSVARPFQRGPGHRMGPQTVIHGHFGNL